MTTDGLFFYVFLFILIYAYLLLPLLWIYPVPTVLDEFSYLLASDTFSSGRLCNNTHTLWPFFESFHIVLKPCYMSKYPPLHAMFLAFGQVTFGHPIFGVKLEMALAMLMVFWCLRAYLSMSWALLGLLLVTMKFGGFHYWSHGYMGAGAALLAGALFFGSYSRLLKKDNLIYFIILLLSIFLLAHSRPFEGALIVFAATIISFKKIMTAMKKIKSLFFTKKGLLVFVFSLILLFWSLYYNFRITGNPFLLPWRLWEKQYFPVPFSLLQTPRTDTENILFPEMKRAVDERWMPMFKRFKNINKWAKYSFKKIITGSTYFFGLLTIIYIGFLPFLFARKEYRWLVFMLTLFFLRFVFPFFYLPHYSAQFVPIVILTMLLGLKLFLDKFANRSFFTFAIPKVLIIAYMFSAVYAYPFQLNLYKNRIVNREDVLGSGPSGVEKILNNTTEKHLVLLRYSTKHNLHIEYVYNKADIDNAKIVWARERRDLNIPNEKLFSYFSDRNIWLLEADKDPVHLKKLR